MNRRELLTGAVAAGAVLALPIAPAAPVLARMPYVGAGALPSIFPALGDIWYDSERNGFFMYTGAGEWAHVTDRIVSIAYDWHAPSRRVRLLVDTIPVAPGVA